jgi:tungstate transport system ATP-binding protein
MPHNPLNVLEISNLHVSRGSGFDLVIDQLTLKHGEVLAILGPNGAGKSTLLLAISKLLDPTSGTIIFKGKNIDQINDLEYRRDIALVLQDPLLFDTSVYNNVCTGLRFRGLSKSEQSDRVEKWIDRLKIDHLRDRHAAQLSSGQAQRVSLARALVLNPSLLLLDEPFSPLDSPTRIQLIEDLRYLLSESETSTVFITHDQEQALSLGDRVAVILDGRLRQAGSPEEVFSSPSDNEVANFLGVENVLPGLVSDSMEGQISVEVQGQLLEAIGNEKQGRQIFFCLRPEDITLWKTNDMPRSSARNLLKGSVISISSQGPLFEIKLDCGFPLTALITRASAQDLDLDIGTAVSVTFKASAVHLIPR